MTYLRIGKLCSPLALSASFSSRFGLCAASATAVATVETASHLPQHCPAAAALRPASPAAAAKTPIAGPFAGSIGDPCF